MNQNNTVLLVSSEESFFFKPLKRALESLGYEVVLADYLGHPVLSRRTLIHKAVRRLPASIRQAIINASQRIVDNRTIRQAKAIRPCLILVSKDKYMFTDTMDRLREIAVTVNWYPETMNTWNSIKRMVDHFDYFFIYDKYVADLLITQGHRNVHYLPFGADMDPNTPYPDVKEYANDVIFLGSFHPQLYPEREVFLDAIKDLGLRVWGNKAWLTTSVKECYVSPLVPDTELINNLYKSSKIVIHSDLITSNVSGTGITLRPYDVTASGSLLLAHDDRKELFDIFKEGEEFVSFHDGPDLRQKVIYYLAHEDERKRIARAGFEGTRKHRTYVSRIKEIFDVVEKDQQSKHSAHRPSAGE